MRRTVTVQPGIAIPIREGSSLAWLRASNRGDVQEMAIAKIKLGDLQVSRLILGGNPISGFSHQDGQLDHEMQHYFTAERCKALYRQAELLGVTTHIARADAHIIRLLIEHWEEGGRIEWVAQTAPELGTPERGAEMAISNRAKAVFIHGGQVDHLYCHGRIEEVRPALRMIREAGLPCGIAGHMAQVFTYAEEHLDCDFYMCSYYNPLPRDETPEHITQEEYFGPEDREQMTRLIQRLSRPAIHYKIMAGGRNDPREAFTFAARAMRPTDAICVGIYPKRNPNELAEDVQYLSEALAALGQY